MHGFTGSFDSHHKSGDYILRTRIWLPFGLSVRDRIPLFTFKNDPVGPLTFTARDGRRWRPNRTFDSFDFATVPLLLQGVVSAIAMPCSAGIHDSGYQFGGLWLVSADGSETFVVLTRDEVDDIGMHQAVTCETGSDYIACKSYSAVHLAGGPTWNSHDRTGANTTRAQAMVAQGIMPASNL